MDRDITIPYLDYQALLDDEMAYNSILKDIRYLLDTATYNRYSKEFDLKMTMNDFLRKYSSDYDYKLKRLREEDEE